MVVSAQGWSQWGAADGQGWAPHSQLPIQPLLGYGSGAGTWQGAEAGRDSPKFIFACKNLVNHYLLEFVIFS